MDDSPHPSLSFPVLTRWSWGLGLPGPGVSQGCPRSHCSLFPPPQKERRLLHNRRLDLDACKARLKKAKAAEAKATVGVLLASCPPALVGAKEGVKGPGVWHDFSPLSLPGEAWLGAAALLTTSGHASLPHLQRTPGGPEPWDPGQTLMG